LANKWYRFEVVWGVGGSITGRVFDSDGTTLLNTVTATDTTFTSGGIAFRGFGPTFFVDTAQKGVVANDDWYSVTLGAGQTALQAETSTPADGPGQFVNTLNPHIELYSPANVLIATGTPLADGRNESLLATGLAPGTYRVRVSAEGTTSGEYFLGVTPLRTPTITSKVDDGLPVTWGPDGSFTVPRPTVNGWTNVTGTGYLNDYTVHAKATNPSASNYAVWNIKATSATPELFATWVARPGNATNATYQIYQGLNLLKTVVVDQTRAPNDALLFGTTLAESLGSVSLTGFTPGVTMVTVRLLTLGANGDVVADGVFDPPTDTVVRLTPSPTEAPRVQLADAVFATVTPAAPTFGLPATSTGLRHTTAFDLLLAYPVGRLGTAAEFSSVRPATRWEAPSAVRSTTASDDGPSRPASKAGSAGALTGSVRRSFITHQETDRDDTDPMAPSKPQEEKAARATPAAQADDANPSGDAGGDE
jgi:hypothetical protein